jgi:fructose-specific phosphotransferase system IIA component
MKLADLITEQVVKIPLENIEKTKIIEELVDILYRSKKITDKEKILKSVLEREKVMTTGIGNGVAIPHGKSEGSPEIAAVFGITKTDVNFSSIDDKPVHLIFLLVGPENTPGPHIKILSRISRLMSKDSFRQKLLQATTPAEAVKLIREEEEKYFQG